MTKKEKIREKEKKKKRKSKVWTQAKRPYLVSGEWMRKQCTSKPLLPCWSKEPTPRYRCRFRFLMLVLCYGAGAGSGASWFEKIAAGASASDSLVNRCRCRCRCQVTRFPPSGGPLKSGTFLGFFECMYKKWPSRGGGTKIQILMCVWPTFLWPT